jgi:deoxycytidylate deaminase
LILPWGRGTEGEGAHAVVLGVTLSTVCEPVYNLEIHGEHVYQVGELGVLVHNGTPAHCPLESVNAPKGSPLFPNSKQIEYGEGLSAIAKERRAAGGVRSGANVAVYEYLQDGVTKTKLFKSVQTKTTSLHSEDVAAIWLKKQGIDPADVKRVYSEFHPCNVCDPNVRSAFPNAAVEYSWPYITSRHPISAIGREAKNATIRGL